MKKGIDSPLKLKLTGKLAADTGSKAGAARAVVAEDKQREDAERNEKDSDPVVRETAALDDSVAQAPSPPRQIPGPQEAPGGVVPPSLPPAENQPVAVGAAPGSGGIPSWLITGGLIAGGVGVIFALDSGGGGGGGSDPPDDNSGTASPVIESPSKETTATVSINENSKDVTTVQATDTDTPSSSLSYSLSGGEDKALFSIDGDSGVLSFIAAPDFEAPGDVGKDNDYSVVVKASDGRQSDTITITVRVKDTGEDDKNDAPSITSNDGGATAAINFLENADAKAALTTVTATDPDADTIVSFSLAEGGDGGLFAIDSKTGALTFKDAPDFDAPADANKDNKYLVTVKATDEAGAFDTQLITVTVANDNEAPVITSDGGGDKATLFFPETSNADVTVVRAKDADAATVLSFSIVEGGDGSLFTIDSGGGNLRFKDSPDFENPVGGDNRYEVTVKVSDGSKSDTQLITVNVTDVSESALSALTAPADGNLTVVSEKGEVFDLGSSSSGTPAAEAGDAFLLSDTDLRRFVDSSFG